MVSLRFLNNNLQRLGLFNLSKENKVDPKRRTSHNIFVVLQYTIVCINLSAYLYSTMTRSVRHSAEFTKGVCELCVASMGLYLTNYLRVNQDQLMSLITFMENSFSKSNTKIIAKYDRKCKLVFITVFAVITCTFFEAFLESFLPLSAKELEIRRLVYRTQDPERRHPYNVRYPCIDESESWAFEIVLVHQTYVIVVQVCFLSLLLSIPPFIMLNVQAQYKILAKYIGKIGDKHRDSFENEIFYTNIETNEVHILTTSDKARRIYLDKNTRIRIYQEYEQNYLKQIVQFHQKLLIFHDKVCCVPSLEIIRVSNLNHNQ
uniref:Odorant receptor n=1 Tax=Cacopsylla melanoneura TaxID=428564 RepID=A0A8D8T6H3_9HEMI